MTLAQGFFGRCKGSPAGYRRGLVPIGSIQNAPFADQRDAPSGQHADVCRVTTVPLDPSRTVTELKELAVLTGDENGAQRVAWTETWERARAFLREKVAPTGLEEEIDEAGNQWFTLPGASERALLIGGHMDSVPDGGWLDGSLNVLAGVEVLRRVAEEGTPPLTVRLVSWADEEGARFGRSLFGSSGASGSMTDQDELRARRDADGVGLPDALAEHGVELDRALEANAQLEKAAAYLELHIEQGPVLESLDLPLGVVLGTFGVERHLVTWRGQAAHSGSTPMDQRHDALAGAAKLALEIRPIAAEVGEGAVCTSGGVVCRPGIVTSVVETAEQLLDQRHLDAGKLARLLELAQEASERFAREEGLEVEWERLWSIEPIPFDGRLIELADEAVREVAGASHRLPSGPLHDAAEVARAGIPTVMLFVQSLRGLSHTKLEDTKEEHLELSVRALDRLTSKALEAFT
jgi:hydantoinase/carbamoylase family amidase